MDGGPGLLAGRVAAHAKRGERADVTLAPLSISIASACGEAEPRSAATTLLLVGMEHGEVPPGEAEPTAQHSSRGLGLKRGACPVGLR